MSQSVKVKIRPGGTLDFPAICVHCSRPAIDSMPLKKRRGRLTRLIDVPLCDQCAAELRRKSGEEERLGRLGQVVAVLATILTVAIAYILLPDGLMFVLRLLIALVIAAIVDFLLLAFFNRRSLAAANPEKLDILNATRLSGFSWRAATFSFKNDDFARRFSAMNEPRLMEVAGDDRTESSESTADS